MIYITPIKQITSAENAELAKQFSQNELRNESELNKIIDGLTKRLTIIHTAEDMLRVRFDYSVKGRDKQSALGYIFSKAFPNNHYSTRTQVKIGYKLPYEIENDFRRSEGQGDIITRLKKAIQAYRTKHQKTFQLDIKNIDDFRFVGYMERPVHNVKYCDIESQKERLKEQFSLYIKHRITEFVMEINPQMSHNPKAEPEKNKKKSINFSNQLNF